MTHMGDLARTMRGMDFAVSDETAFAAYEADLLIGKIRCIQRMSEEDIEQLITDAKRAGETTTLTPLQALDRTIENQIRKLAADGIS